MICSSLLLSKQSKFQIQIQNINHMRVSLFSNTLTIRLTSLWRVLFSSVVFPQTFRCISAYQCFPSPNHFSSIVSYPSMSGSEHMNQDLVQKVSFINADLAKIIDDRLMSRPGYTIDQLMELAGYSVACAGHDILKMSRSESKNVFIFCGPGNNGGDGLVAARHLKHFGYEPHIVYPKQAKGDIFVNLVHQLHELNIPIFSEFPSQEILADTILVIDALFGFSFKGPLREPYGSMIQWMQSMQHTLPILSVDVPSGWDVDHGDVFSTGFSPSATISLTLPKNCMSTYCGTHYVGGRFMPPSLASEFNLIMPNYGVGVSQVCVYYLFIYLFIFCLFYHIDPFVA